MKNLIFLVLSFVAINCSMSAEAKTADSNEWKLLEIVNRLCPSQIWDSWIIDCIRVNEKLNQVDVVIKHDWNERVSNMNEEQARKFAQFFIAEVYEAYNDTIKGNSGEGDFVMYLALGTMFKYMYKDKTSLKITLIDEHGKKAIDRPLIVSWQKLSPELY